MHHHQGAAFWLSAPSATPVARRLFSRNERSRFSLGLVDNAGVFTCRRCARFDAKARPSGPTLCDSCFEEANEEQERREQLRARVPEGHVIGEQPAICQWEACSEPFMAAHAGVKFHSAACRAKAWRAAREAERAALVG